MTDNGWSNKHTFKTTYYPDNIILKKLRSWNHPETVELNKLLSQFEKDKKYPEHYNLDWGTISYEEMIKE